MANRSSPSPDPAARPRLAADIGGTRVRFALIASHGHPIRIVELRCADYPDPATAADELLRDLSGSELPAEGAFAIAAPVTGDLVQLTNHPWSFSVERIRCRLGLDRLEALNDFAALALSLDGAGPGDWESIRDVEGTPGQPLAVIGPGTGLGAAGLVRAAAFAVPVVGEGGHRDLAAADEREWRVVEAIAREFDHVSAERLISGPGLRLLYRTIRELAGAPGDEVEAAEIDRRAREGEPAAVEATGLFSSWLGAVAGDLVLTLGARGGLFLAGAMLHRMGAAFDRQRFVERFLAKGRFRDYLEEVPVRLLLRPSEMALRGAARWLDRPAARAPKG